MRKFTAKFIKKGVNAFSLSVNFTVSGKLIQEIPVYAENNLRIVYNLPNIDNYKLLSITEK